MMDIKQQIRLDHDNAVSYMKIAINNAWNLVKKTKKYYVLNDVPRSLIEEVLHDHNADSEDVFKDDDFSYCEWQVGNIIFTWDKDDNDLQISYE